MDWQGLFVDEEKWQLLKSTWAEQGIADFSLVGRVQVCMGVLTLACVTWYILIAIASRLWKWITGVQLTGARDILWMTMALIMVTPIRFPVAFCLVFCTYWTGRLCCNVGADELWK